VSSKSKTNPVVGRERIIQAAFSLFAERGFYGVSISDVAESAGLVKSSIYHHFESKEALYLAVLNETFDKISAEMKDNAVGKDWQTRLKGAIRTLAQTMGPRSHALSLILEGITHTPTNANRHKKDELRGKLLQVIANEVAQGIACGDLQSLDPTMTTTCLIGLIVSVLQADQNWSEKRRVDFAFNLFLQGATRRKNKSS
jgi:AcrR family transcriptional regulator